MNSETSNVKPEKTPYYPCNKTDTTKPAPFVAKNGSCKKKHRCVSSETCSATYPEDVKVQNKKNVNKIGGEKNMAKKTVEKRDASNVEVKASDLKVASIPFETQINKYGFLAFSKPELRVLGLETDETEGVKAKMTGEVKVQIVSFDAASKQMVIQIL